MFQRPPMITRWLGSDPVDGFILREVDRQEGPFAVILQYETRFNLPVVEKYYTLVDTLNQGRAPTQAMLDTLVNRIRPLHYSKINLQVAAVHL